MQSTMQDLPAHHHRHLPSRPRRASATARSSPSTASVPPRQFRRGRRARRAGSPPRCTASASSPATASARSCGTPGAPRGLLRGPVHGRGAAHAQHPPVRRPARLHRQPRRGQVIIVDASLMPLLARVLPELTTVEHFIVVGDGDASRARARRRSLRYEELLAAQPADVRLARARRARAPRRCATRAAPPATRRASSTATARPICTRMAACTGDALALTRARPHAADRADVPRQRVGPALRGAGWPAPTWSCPAAFLQAEPLVPTHRDRAADVLAAPCRRSGAIARATPRRTTSISSSLRAGHVRRRRPCRARSSRRFERALRRPIVPGAGA